MHTRADADHDRIERNELVAEIAVRTRIANASVTLFPHIEKYDRNQSFVPLLYGCTKKDAAPRASRLQLMDCKLMTAGEREASFYKSCTRERDLQEFMVTQRMNMEKSE